MSLKKIYIDEQVTDAPVTEAIRACLDLPCEIVSDAGEVFREISAATAPVRRGKEVLFLTRNRGAFVRDCPGTRHYTCCGYRILHIGTFCVMDCSYCILQSYFHPPVLQFFVNQEEMLSELDALFAEKKTHRVGTGEFTDSMIWEWYTPLSDILVPRFARQSHVVLELKTKTTAVDALAHLPHNKKTIMAWSVNTEAVIRSDERHTASLSARLRAAAKCASWGYPLAFHFDPMVIYEGCEADYQAVVEKIFSHVSPADVVWISLGTFRFMPSLKPIIQERFPDSKIIYGEFIQGLDGKMRYFKPLRISLYRKVARRIRELAPEVCVYFCMEDDEVWEKSLGFVPDEQGGLPAMLDARAEKCCELG